jgi:hypothetical protein
MWIWTSCQARVIINRYALKLNYPDVSVYIFSRAKGDSMFVRMLLYSYTSTRRQYSEQNRRANNLVGASNSKFNQNLSTISLDGSCGQTGSVFN